MTGSSSCIILAFDCVRRLSSVLGQPKISSAEGSAIGARSSRQRSRVSNGSKLVAGVDGRSAEARRLRDLLISFADDCGGAASLTQAQRVLIDRAADLTMRAEKLQAAMLRGEDISDEQLTRISNALSRMLHRLGLKKPRARPASLAGAS
jgi:hypothetical protein